MDLLFEIKITLGEFHSFFLVKFSGLI